MRVERSRGDERREEAKRADMKKMDSRSTERAVCLVFVLTGSI